jgi:O-antigen/teichoic acid export membrane protein
MTVNISSGKDESISRRRSTIWNFFFLNVGFLVTLFNGLLIIPLYLHYINASMYGAWLATGNILTWITIIDPGVAGVLLQRVAFHIGENNKKEIGLAITSGILVSTAPFFVALLLGYGLSFFIMKIARIDAHYSGDILSAFRIAMWGTALSLLADTFRNIILAYQKTRLHGILLYSVLIASILLNVVLLVLHFGVYALAYTSLFRGLGILCFAIFYSVRLLKKNQIGLKFDYTYFKSFSKIFAFTFSSSLFETVANNVDLIIVSRYLGSRAVTMLDLSRRPVRMVSGLANNVTISMLPTLPHLFGSGDKRRIEITVTRVWNIIFWICGFIIGGFILLNYSFVRNWVGSQFWIGNTNNVLVCLSVFLWAIGYNFSNVTLSMGDIRNNSIITIVRSILYIGALLVLVRMFGMTGIILAFLVPGLIMVGYYPPKLFKSIISKDQEFRQHVLQVCIGTATFLAICSLIACLVPINVNWVFFACAGVIYSIGYLIFIFAFSRAFRNEAGLLIASARVKLNLR